MKDTRSSQDWRALCELASRELDPEKLVDLVTKINKALEDSQQKTGDRIKDRRYTAFLPSSRSLSYSIVSQGKCPEFSTSAKPHAVLCIPTSYMVKSHAHFTITNDACRCDFSSCSTCGILTIAIRNKSLAGRVS